MTNDLHEKLNSRKFRNGYKPPEENVIFSIQGKNIGTSQSFVCFQGLPKAGKSTFITSAIASAFTHWDIFGMKINFPKDRKRICYIDTESSDFDYYRVLERIRSQIICDPLPHNFDSFLFREDSPQDIQSMIEIYLQENKDCSVLVIDGILDLIADFNSVEQSFYLVQWLKKITKQHDLLILCVLHLGKKDQNSIGHIGSYLDRKSQSVLKIEKNKDKKTLDLIPTFLRSTDDFDPISIQYTGGNWHQVNTDPVQKGSYIYGMEKTALINKLLFENRTYKDLISDFSEFTGKGQSTAKKIVKEWIAEGSIFKVGDHYQKK
jgi:hypothetical protein